MIHIFATGGTFDKIYFDALSEFSIGEPQAHHILHHITTNLDYCIESLTKKDSLDLDDADRLYIQRKITHSKSDKIIVIHGTDTMTHTAQSIAHITNKTVVFVGSMQPAILRETDAHFNLGFAFAAVQLLATGTYIAMNGQVFPYDQVQKNRSSMQFEHI